MVDILILKNNIDKLIDDLNSKEDTVVVISSIGYIDACLYSILKCYLLENKVTEKLLSSGSGALSSISVRNSLLFSLGLISEEIHNDIKYLCKIRNRFAHNHFSLSFKNKDIVDLCNNFKFIYTVKNGDFEKILFNRIDHIETRIKFIITVVFVKNYLIDVCGKIKK